MPGQGEDAFAALLDADALERLDQREGRFLHGSAGRPRAGLVDALAVDQVGLGLEIARAGRDEAFEEIGVHRGAQEPGPVRILLRDRDDEVGDLAVAQVDVADESALLDGQAEPELVAVVAGHQVIGADVGPVVAVGVDDPQVGETGQFLLQRAVGPAETAGLREPGESDVFRQKAQIGSAFGQELVDDGAVVLDLEAQGFDGARLQGVRRVDVDDAPQD